MKIVYKKYTFPVPNAGDAISKEFDLEKNAGNITGITFSSNKRDQLFYRGQSQVEIGGREVFPEGFDCQLLMAGTSVPPAEKFYPLDQDPGNGKIRFRFKDDQTVNNVVFAAYQVTITVRYESAD